MEYYAIGRDVADSIPDKVTGFFNRPNPSNRTIWDWLRSTLPLTALNINESEYQERQKPPSYA
jgi:hypothetical protein